ncbi:MAG: glycosyltransferase [Acholeplasmataceae bacterium]|nr:glycosyltransferase [Acholeplasmataceae bacterium]
MSTSTDQKRLRIGLFVDSFFPMVDGVINVVDQYAKWLMKVADVTVFAPKARDRSYQDQSPYRVIRSQRVQVPMMDYDLSLPFLDNRFQTALRHAHLDIVHVHSPFSIGKAGVEYARKHHIPVIATFHSQFRQDFYERTKSKTLTDLAIANIMHTFNRCDAYYAVNRKVADIYVTYGATKPVGVLPNGTDLVPVNDDQKLNELKSSHGIRDEEKVFLFVGRLDKVKNIFFTAEALAILHQKQFPFKMIFIGTGPDEKELQAKCQKLGIGKMCLFLGKIMDRRLLSVYYRMADLFLFPSLYDSSSLVQIEAASQKTPVVFLEGATTADNIIKGINGYLAPNDHQSYAECIIRILGDQKTYDDVCERAFTDLYRTWDQAVNEGYWRYMEVIRDYQAKSHD